MDRKYFSIPEAAARLGLSRIAVFKRVKKGQLEALRFGRNWAVPAAALETAEASGIAARAPGPKIISPLPPPLPSKEALPPSSPDTEMDSMGWD